ncbi:MAG: ParB/RepB/Spo0J family partition protein [Clostridia bacterium]|nr:ParB/RepB/Spo0J family partition protein [Clostridia bacterium]
MASNKGLGRGLSALFLDTEEAYENAQKEEKREINELPLKDIYPNPDQPRKAFDETALAELADSIREHGVIEPIVVNKEPNGMYRIIAGERRYRASRLAGKETIPVVIKQYTERQIKEISLIENLQREDLNPIEAALGLKVLMDEYKLTQEELSARIGKSRSAIANTLRLLNLSEEVMALVSEGKLSAGHARALVVLPQGKQLKIAIDAVREGYSVREIERAVKNAMNPPPAKPKKQEMSLELNDLVERFRGTFKTKVSLIGNDQKGRITIDYYTRDDLDRISDLLDELSGKHSL